jgi:8-oxo-dGTP pyrophosphatase MutT (NUDIX family)
MGRKLMLRRRGVRAILLTSAQEVLLMRIRAPDSGEAFWIAPGGGLEVGESFEQALRRELEEELGLQAFEIGPLVWRRQHTFHWDGRRICQREHYHIVEVDRFEPRMSDRREAATLDRFRWWRASELAHATERLTPLTLADIVARYLALGPPSDPPEWEVLVD